MRAHKCVQEATRKLLLIEGEKGGKSKLIASNKNLKAEIIALCEDEGIGVSNSVEYFGINIKRPGKQDQEDEQANKWYRQ